MKIKKCYWCNTVDHLDICDVSDEYGELLLLCRGCQLSETGHDLKDVISKWNKLQKQKKKEAIASNSEMFDIMD